MSLYQILLFSILLIAFRVIAGDKQNKWFIFIISFLALFWFQPATSIRNLYYWFPFIGIGLSIVAWLTITDHEEWLEKENIHTLFFIIIFSILIGLFKYLSVDVFYKFSSTPKSIWIVIFWALIILVAILIKNITVHRGIHWILLFFILSILIVTKTPALVILTSQIIRSFNNQAVQLASSSDLQWVGFSYLSFRIIHVLRDHKLGKINKVNLRDFLNYLLFFPAFLSGPIDRIERFLLDLRNNESNRNADITQGLQRILIGSAKKFIVADSLALLALTEYSVYLIETPFWTWILVFAYGFRIYFDFAGYTDIAIGLAKITGISLPENFRSPYLSSNLIIFWNNWHITLTQWFRTYYFNPLNRFIKSQKWNISENLFILFMQLSTMVLIALWHGVTFNFIIWGLWHGLGLFINNRWINLVKPYEKSISSNTFFKSFIKIISIALTFIFVSLGWVWFALPSIESSLIVFNKLVGK